jgi:oxygen-independent coproporphyrinogen-3 oxidase
MAARAAGFASVSLDLLYDVPGQTLASWTETLEAAVALEPDHVSAYALALDDPEAEGIAGPSGDHLPTPPGARRWRESARSEQDEDRAAGAYGLADALLEGSGYPWYELSNWARPGHESRHNLAYWERRPYAAVGPGAHSFDGAMRRWNAARLDAWTAALVPASASAVPTLPPGGAEPVDAVAAEAEALFLGLRLAQGIPREAALGRIEAFAWAAEYGLVEDRPGDRVRLTLRGRLLSNELFARLI